MTNASPFEILPAIDLRGGRVVRLREGDFGRETAYSDNPIGVARGFAEAGARWLHVVDLDGARAGRPAHAGVVASIVAAVGDRCQIEVAGGLRTADAVAERLAGGAARAVVGTAALADPSLVGGLVAAFGPDRIAIAIDVRDGRAVGHGWSMGSAGIEVDGAIGALADAGVRWFEVTAIERDGLLAGPDLALYERLVGLVEPGGGCIVASGGIASLDDLRAVRELGASGAIIGRALYDGQLTIADALAMA